jgi:23S rRNA (pseudouridine1915-N3)-methyltransferase
MRYHLITIGQLKRTFYQEGCQFYMDRLKAYTKLELIELKEAKAKTPEQVKDLESQSLLNAAVGYVIALDEKGKTLTSKQCAETITKLETQSISSISLLIGGAEGHSDDLKKKANELWSLSKLTLPHDLARLVLLEQLYRAETIRAGHPYHRE